MFSSVKNYAVVAMVALLGLTGCSTKIDIAALEPAEVDRAANLKQVGVLEFQKDEVGLSSKLEALLANYKLKDSDEKPYFTVVSRTELDKIIGEIKFQQSGLSDNKKLAELGKLTNAQALISGTVSNASSKDTYFQEERTRCASVDSKGRCTSYQRYTVSCTKRDTTLGAQIKMIDVARGDLVTAKNYTETDSSKHCSDSTYSRGLKDGAVALEEMSNKVADQFLKSISPHYRYFKVELIGSLDVKLEKPEQDKFKNSIEFIKAGRNDRAEELLTDLMTATQGQSYAVSYNLGVMKEAKGELEEADKLYAAADKLTVKPVKPIDAAVSRIKTAIEKQKKAQEQIGRQ